MAKSPKPSFGKKPDKGKPATKGGKKMPSFIMKGK